MTKRGFVVVRLGGGLGNQMFQYATGRAFSERTRQPLMLDFEAGPGRDALLGLRLGKWKQLDIATALSAGLAPWPGRKGTRLLRPIAEHRGVAWLSAPAFGIFEEEVTRWSGPAVLTGHWQSERYFTAIESTIRDEFRSREPLRPEIQELILRIRDEASVGVQVRRGDYRAAVPVEDLPDEDFYSRGVEEIGRRLGKRLSVYGFSDDADWIRDTMPEVIPGAVPISGLHTRNEYEDLLVLAACGHQVISPSTFAWWGAWLNPNPRKIVVAPHRWVWDWAAPDLVPDRWLRM